MSFDRLDMMRLVAKDLSGAIVETHLNPSSWLFALRLFVERCKYSVGDAPLLGCSDLYTVCWNVVKWMFREDKCTEQFLRENFPT